MQRSLPRGNHAALAKEAAHVLERADRALQHTDVDDLAAPAAPPRQQRQHHADRRLQASAVVRLRPQRSQRRLVRLAVDEQNAA
jgi:hypothetical protein